MKVALLRPPENWLIRPVASNVATEAGLLLIFDTVPQRLAGSPVLVRRSPATKTAGAAEGWAGPALGCRVVCCGGWFGALGARAETPAGTSMVPAGLVRVQMPLVPLIRVEPSLRISMRPPVPRMPMVAVGVEIAYRSLLTRPM